MMFDVIFTILFILFVGFSAGYFISSLLDFIKKPKLESNKLEKVWVQVTPSTWVYQYVHNNEIHAKVVKQDDSLWRITMWNGYFKEYVNVSDAKTAAQEYKPRIYK